MKKPLMIAFLLLGFLEAYSQQTPAEIAVLRLSEKKNLWLTQSKLDSIAALLDTRCVYVHSNGWAQNATDVLADARSGKMRYVAINITEAKARQYEKVVVVNSRGNFSGSFEGKDFKLELAVTEVYMNRKAGWKLISRHASRFPEP